ncbi:hypothetical protein Tco_0947236, partial [Tanacetum coccineum]
VKSTISEQHDGDGDVDAQAEDEDDETELVNHLYSEEEEVVCHSKLMTRCLTY